MNIYYAGYLLKRSNNPVSSLSPLQHHTLEESPLPAFLRLDNEHDSRKIENNNHENLGADDILLGDWHEGMLAPPLGGDSSAGIPDHDSLLGDDDENVAPHYPTTEPLSLPFRKSISGPSDCDANCSGQPITPTADVIDDPLHEESDSKLHQQQIVDTTEEEEKRRQIMFLDMAADFFGEQRPSLTLEHNSEQSTKFNDRAMHKDYPSIESQLSNTAKRSAPIKMPDKLTNEGERLPAIVSGSNQSGSHSTGSGYYQRSQSEANIETNNPPPADFQDEKGHIWRAKYCILQDGVFYFYRNQEDGESLEAKAERSRKDLNTSAKQEKSNTYTFDSGAFESLARSPIPHRRVRSPQSPEPSSTTHLWEKRVRVESIGSVRKAESEYGPNTFALLSPSGEKHMSVSDSIEDAEDKLILRARNADETNVWIFQFRVSLEAFLENLLSNAGSRRALAKGLSAATPSFGGGPFATHSLRHSSFSPSKVPGAITLSHGHGRTHSRERERRRLKQLQTESVFTPPRQKVQPPRVPLVHQSKTDRHASASTATTASLSPSLSIAIHGNLSPSSPTSMIASPPFSDASAGRVTPSAAGASKSDTTRPPLHGEGQGTSPEHVAPPSGCPETERPPPTLKPSGKYVPPALRRRLQEQQKQGEVKAPEAPPKVFRKYVPPALRNKQREDGNFKPSDDQLLSHTLRARSSEQAPSESRAARDGTHSDMNVGKAEEAPSESKPFELGGCADPRLVQGSISDNVFVPRKASRLDRKLRTEPFGMLHSVSGNIKWDIGAVSECGVREANEDSYLIAGNLLEAFSDSEGSVLNRFSSSHPPGLFCIFDGHVGDQAARYAAENLTGFLEREGQNSAFDMAEGRHAAKTMVGEALLKLDEAFCKLCVEDGRQWESGATALVATLVDNHLVVGNLGDARAVVSRSVEKPGEVAELETQGWSRLPEGDSGSKYCMWKQVSDSHHPSRGDERQRIEDAGGWVTFESDITFERLKRVDLEDEDVLDILHRCFADRYAASPKAAAPQREVEISRVCGELAVSRSIGDRDFKALFNTSNATGKGKEWDSPPFLMFPDDHSRLFVGDLVTSEAEFQTLRMGDSNAYEEFFLLACDGLWDVMDPDDAVRVTRELLFDLEWPASEAAFRLAEIAVHLGSSDNVTVIVVAMGRTSENKGNSTET